MSSPSDPVRVGILSTAHVHTGAYAAALVANPDAVFVGVADEDESRGRKFAQQYGVDWYPMLNLLDRVDGVIVCAPNANHADRIEAAAEAGVDVLCEKPLEVNTSAAERAVTVCESAGVNLGMAMPLRFAEPVRRAERALAEDTIGEIHAISATNRGRLPSGWFLDPEQSGGGAVTDHTPHIVDLVHHLTDERVREIYAESGTRMHDVEVEDINLLSMELGDGTQLTLDGSWSRPEEWPIWGDATLELIGDKGVIAVECFDQTLRYVGSGADGRNVQTPFWGTDPDKAMIADFTTAIANNRPPATTGVEGAAVVEVIEAAYRSIEQSEPQSIEYH